METFLQDVRIALRAFRHAPAFALTAVVTLGLGIGATTAIFSALSAVLLKTAPLSRRGGALQPAHGADRWTGHDRTALRRRDLPTA